MLRLFNRTNLRQVLVNPTDNEPNNLDVQKPNINNLNLVNLLHVHVLISLKV
jgi:hypothetical protein